MPRAKAREVEVLQQMQASLNALKVRVQALERVSHEQPDMSEMMERAAALVRHAQTKPRTRRVPRSAVLRC